MEAVSVPDWAAFTAELQKLRDELTENFPGRAPELLFRGQSDSSWPLTTTLERAGCEGMSFDEYYRLTVQRVRPAVETITGATWDVPDYDLAMEKAFLSLTVNPFFPRGFPSPSFYRYMVYLRHDGFPSPLLDWTSSMHIASFFAFRTAGAAEKRSIYVSASDPSHQGWRRWGAGNAPDWEICSRARQALLAAIRLHDSVLPSMRRVPDGGFIRMMRFSGPAANKTTCGSSISRRRNGSRSSSRSISTT